jgi:hypothetical protein
MHATRVGHMTGPSALLVRGLSPPVRAGGPEQTTLPSQQKEECR